MTEERLKEIENDPGRHPLEVRQLVAEFRRLRSLAEDLQGTICGEFCVPPDDHSETCTDARKALGLTK